MILLIVSGNIAEDIKVFSLTIIPIKRNYVLKKTPRLFITKTMRKIEKSEEWAFSICGYQPIITRTIIILYY